MNTIKTIIALMFPLSAAAQLSINFENADTYKNLDVYDAWEESPFRRGLLRGNVKVIANELNQEDEILGRTINETRMMLAMQCSRWGSNTFGARIDLNEPFELTTTTKYVHVLINKPTSGRMMLIGLGKRTDRAAQSAETEQFWELSRSAAVPGKWSDAVFAIKGAGGIEIHSLVVVPQCESPHALSADFAAYIDEIEINDTATPRVIYSDYPINYEDTQISGKANYYLSSIALNGSADGNQTITVGSRDPQVIYRPMLEKSFTAKAGEKLTPIFSYTGNWMNGYVYLDRNNDGRFSAELTENFTIPEGSDLMSYAYVETVENTEGHLGNSGTKVSGNQRNTLNPPAFSLPENLEPGYYRMRFKVDWGSVDPAGRNTATNDIVSNGGMIVDVRMNIHTDEVTISRSGGLNGDILTEDGSELDTKKVPFGQSLTIIARPASDNFCISYIRVRHGYNLDGDSLIHSTPQYIDEYFPAYLFRDNKFTIPAECIDGDVIIEPYFVDLGNISKEDYARNFADDLTVARADRHLDSFTFTATQGGSSTITLPTGTNYVYRNLTSREVSVVPGDEVAVAIGYTGNAMHHYLYVDLNQDGQFDTSLHDDGTPTFSSELLSYSYYNQRNSLGQSITAAPGTVPTTTMPSFTIPQNLPAGIYRARLKTDWNNIDPAGHWSDGGTNNIDQNGGQVVDFLLNVHAPTQTLTLLTTNGSINGASYTALPCNLPVFTQLTVSPQPVAKGYVAEKMTIRHGHNFDGPQHIRGNRQWSQFEVPAGSYVIPADSVNGDVTISVDFVATSDAEYRLVFSDEFDAPDGTRPDNTYWRCSPRYSATWNRWIVDDARVAFQQGGQFVARAIPNPDTNLYSGNMITGAIQTSGKFSFQYGKIEARILTNPHTGNFPAFWLMPDDQSAGWPNCGEIDIWEQIDNQNTAYHTLHTGYAQSMYSTHETCSTDRYHTFGFEWDEQQMIWYLDGKQVGQYKKSSNSDPRSWPFDKPYYIILNQSVGNGSWAANADINHIYETRFDWVRVYQKDSQTGIEDISSYSDDANENNNELYDLSGRRVIHPHKGSIYINDGKKIVF